MRLRFEQQHFAAGERQCARHREAHDARADDHAFDLVCHMLNLSCNPRTLRRMIALAAVSIVFAACARDVDTYAKIQDPLLLKAALHTVTLASDDAAIAARLREQGYQPVAFASNYPASIPVEAALWEVPEPFAAKVAQFTAPSAQAPGVRLLIMPLAVHGFTTDPATEKRFLPARVRRRCSALAGIG